MNIKEAIARLIDRRDLTEREMVDVMNEIMTGHATDAQIGAFLISLRLKGETVDEITGGARVMREKAQTIGHTHESVLDTCGTGGDASGTFNISTTAAFIAAGAGVAVAKHGNRSVSSRAGSADLFKALGVDIEAEVEKLEECLEKCGIAFLFAPKMHAAMKHAIGPRREIGVRTIFNLLGPLTNPAGAVNQLIGVYDPKLTEPIAKVMRRLGSRHVMVVHGSDGLDEITLTGYSRISELKDDKVKNWTLDPTELGFSLCKPEDLMGGDPRENAAITLSILKGEDKGPKRQIAVLNAAAAIVTSGKANDLQEGVKLAEDSIDSGKAIGKLEALKSIL